MSYSSTPILTMGMVTGEQISFDLTIDPSLCAVHRGGVDPDIPMLTMTLRHGLLDEEVTVSICRMCFSEWAPEALAVLEAANS